MRTPHGLSWTPPEKEMEAPERHEIMISYLKLKVVERDWHGVRDAAADLELMEARNPELKSLRKGATWNNMRKD